MSFWGGVIGAFFLEALKPLAQGLFKLVAKSYSEPTHAEKEEEEVNRTRFMQDDREAEASRKPAYEEIRQARPSAEQEGWRRRWQPVSTRRRRNTGDYAAAEQDVASASFENFDNSSQQLSWVVKRLAELSSVVERLFPRKYDGENNSTEDKVEEYMKRHDLSADTGEMLPEDTLGEVEVIPEGPRTSKSKARRGIPKKETTPEVANIASPALTPVISHEPVISYEPVISHEPVVSHEPVISHEPGISQEYLDQEMMGGLQRPKANKPPPPARNEPPPAKTTPVPIVTPVPQTVVASKPDEKAASPSPSSLVGTVPVNTSAPSAPPALATPPLSVETKPASVAPSPAASVIPNATAPQKQPLVGNEPGAAPVAVDTPGPSPVAQVATPQSRPGSLFVPSVEARLPTRSALTSDALRKHTDSLHGVKNKDDDGDSHSVASSTPSRDEPGAAPVAVDTPGPSPVAQVATPQSRPGSLFVPSVEARLPTRSALTSDALRKHTDSLHGVKNKDDDGDSHSVASSTPSRVFSDAGKSDDTHITVPDGPK
ncbi:hypothetical protein QFC21_000832 [Naganishia friedmannii]|uniref:Uncharacterized protein n=1 Tax=Naganishia friedmannii TaxID=89922 RepID=A0ACC2W8F3_9TREE|nr:hypothetical protein QFC21_000832 [Naganishia friedmannii]